MPAVKKTGTGKAPKKAEKPQVMKKTGVKK